MANKVIKSLAVNKQLNDKSKVAILGVTFKENCPDVRNTKVVDIYKELKSFNLEVDVYDPLALPAEVEEEYGIVLKGDFNPENYQAIVLAVAHTDFLSFDWDAIHQKVTTIFDVKGILDISLSNERL